MKIVGRWSPGVTKKKAIAFSTALNDNGTKLRLNTVNSSLQKKLIWKLVIHETHNLKYFKVFKDLKKSELLLLLVVICVLTKFFF